MSGLPGQRPDSPPEDEAQRSRRQAQQKGSSDVESRAPPVGIPHERKALEVERRVCREAAEQTGPQKQAHVRPEPGAVFGENEGNPEGERSEEIGGKRGPRKTMAHRKRSERDRQSVTKAGTERPPNRDPNEVHRRGSSIGSPTDWRSVSPTNGSPLVDRLRPVPRPAGEPPLRCGGPRRAIERDQRSVPDSATRCRAWRGPHRSAPRLRLQSRGTASRHGR